MSNTNRHGDINIFLFVSFAIVAIFQYIFDTSQEQISLFCPLKALLTICFCVMYISASHLVTPPPLLLVPTWLKHAPLVRSEIELTIHGNH